jgi:hypothetical protein
MPSSVINHFSYEPDAMTLNITFTSGIKYKYLKVPPEVYNMLKAAGSKGRYFNFFIKGKFKYKKQR